jgi:hypothetical protein
LALRVQQAKVLWSLAHLRLKVDEPTLERFKKIASRLAVQQGGMTAKNRERLRPFDDAETVAACLGLPQRIRREVETKKRNPRSNAVLAQMAAAIALLQAAPIRLKNLTGLNLTDNLIARAKSFYLVIGEHETKNREPIDFELPAETVAMYVREYRPFLLKEPSDALFPGEGGRAKPSGCSDIDRRQRRLASTPAPRHAPPACILLPSSPNAVALSSINVLQRRSHLRSPSRPTANISPRFSGRIKCHDACN